MLWYGRRLDSHGAQQSKVLNTRQRLGGGRYCLTYDSYHVGRPPKCLTSKAHSHCGTPYGRSFRGENADHSFSFIR